MVVDATFVPTLHSEVLKESDWSCPSLHAAVKFAWAVLLRECASRVTFSGLCECVWVCVCVCVCVCGCGCVFAYFIPRVRTNNSGIAALLYNPF